MPESVKLQKEKSNTFNEFFGRIHSFDLETTGLNTESKDFSRRSLVWQVGLFTEGKEGGDIHTNPFYYFDKSSPGFVSDLSEREVEGLLRSSAGEFSEIAWNQGNFKNFTQDYLAQNLTTFSKSLEETLGTKVKPQDVVVLQNMNFENRVLKSYRDMGILEQNSIDRLSSKMETVSLDKTGSVLNLFERPLEVQRVMRQADILYNTQYLLSRDSESFKTYTGLLNKSLDQYEKAILNPSRQGAVAVELMDITKATLANASTLGYIAPERATVGLNLEFLSQALYGESEKHTAYADAELTTKVYQDLLKMNKEMRQGNLSEETLNNLKKISEAQTLEIDKNFNASVRSVLEDFNIKGTTRVQGRYQWYAPDITLKAKGKKEVVLEGTKSQKKITTSLEEALEGLLSKYSVHEDNKEWREGVVQDIIERQKQGTNYKDLQLSLSSSPPVPKEVTLPRESKIFNKKFLGAAAGVGLAYAAFVPERPPREDYKNSVASEFYDDLYLGTAFVQFDERNKHYMM